MRVYMCAILFLLVLSLTVLARNVEVINANSYFEDDLEGWEILLANGAVAEISVDDSDSIKGSQCVYVEIKELGSGAGFWEIKFSQTILDAIEVGETYTISVWAKGEGARQIRPHLRVGPPPGGPFQAHAMTFDITTEWAEYSNTFTASGEGKSGLLDIALGTTKGNVWFDNFRIYEGQYEEDPDLGRTKKKLAVESCGKLATTWGKIRCK